MRRVGNCGVGDPRSINPMRKFVLAVAVTFTSASFVVAEQFTLLIANVSDDGTTVTGAKFPKGSGFGKIGKGQEVTVKLAPGVKVFKSKFADSAKGFVTDGDDLKVAGLHIAVLQ